MRQLALAILGLSLCGGIAWAVTDTTITITDQGGKPIPEATVSLERADKKPSPKTKTATTDKSGKITVTHDEKDKDDKGIIIVTVKSGDKTMTVRTTLAALLSGGTIVVETKTTPARPQTAEPKQAPRTQPIYRTQTPYPTRVVNDWTGTYIGGWAGGAWGRSSWSNPFDGPLGTLDMRGVILGGYAGANAQFGNLVVGVEAGAAWTGIQGGFSSHGWTFGGYTRGIEELTGRVGVLTGDDLDTLWFLKGGGAISQYSVKTDWPEIGTHFQTTTTLGGWTAGVGVERKWSPRISYRLEYGYYNFGNHKADLVPNKDFDAYQVNLSNTQVHVFTVGVGYALTK